MIKKLLITAVLALTACAAENNQLSIADLEKAGFEKQQQQLFQMINATDGWSGRWNNEVIEVYTFENNDLADNPFYTSINIESNASNWADKCIHKNVILLSKGTESCQLLSDV